jgi:photosystem II stability/assembly factor-like uncharacterized protein
MAKRVHILVGTKKGAFIFDGNPERNDWTLRGPYCETWPLNHVVADQDTGVIYGGGGNEWFGPAVWKSEDLGKSWTHSSEGLKYAEGETPIKAVWSLSARNGHLYAGVDPAGLFVSEDKGESWRHIDGLQKHPSRAEWQPGGAGLILHAIQRHPDDEGKLWVAISTGGVFYTEDGGESWQPRNKGTRQDFAPDSEKYPEFGQCVHSITMAAGNPNRLYQQNHCGMYRSDDGGVTWESIEAGLPSTFGFPSAAHPTDPDTLFLIPLNGDSIGRYMPEGSTAVYRTRDAGKSWQALNNGLPRENAFFGVLRQAMATDRLDPAGIYFGTSSGSLYASNDEGENWHAVAHHLPAILSVETLVSKTA